MKNYLAILFLALFPLCTRPVDEPVKAVPKKVSLKLVFEETAKDPFVSVPVKVGGFCVLGTVFGLMNDPEGSFSALGLSLLATGQLCDSYPMISSIAFGVPAVLYAGNVFYRFAKSYQAEKKRCESL